MMQYFVIGLVSFLISGITLFSGFGLGTVLMPVFAVFFPVYIAVILTAVVHLSNNIFKFILLGKYTDRDVLIRFGIPAVLSAALGARALFWFSGMPPLAVYRFMGHDCQIQPIKLIIAVLMVVFALFELIPRFSALSFGRKYLSLGGFLSGFFGGFSGYQGALRSAFLIKSGLSKESFISTTVVISCLVDISRLFIYGMSFSLLMEEKRISLLLTAIICAFSGVFVGTRLLKKVAIRAMQVLIAVMLFAIAFGLGTGIL